ncbi:hypothetical protein GX408_18485, partial [bacterium]|nr:hypothetical protein [bacterium]
MKKKPVLFTILLAVVSFFRCADQPASDSPSLTFCCLKNNDLYQILSPSKVLSCARWETVEQAISAAPPRSGVLILADGYPDRRTEIDAALLADARAKGLRVYLEFPASLPGLPVDSVKTTRYERAVVSSEFFLPELKPLTILAVHDCHYAPFKAPKPHLVLSRVAGFDQAIYGLGKEIWPLLTFSTDSALLISSTKLSQFISARYAPEAAWSVIWQKILAWACPGAGTIELQWIATVRPSFSREEVLPQAVEATALQRGAAWFTESRLLMHQPDESRVPALVQRSDDRSAIEEPIGDGSHGILEGYASSVCYDGRQPRRITRRSDCISECAMGLAFGSQWTAKNTYAPIAGRLLNFLFFDCMAQQQERADPSHPAFGLIVWGISSPAWQIAYYGDDNARVILSAMASAALLQSTAWDIPLLKALFANLRTSGQYGFRTNRINMPDLTANGWQYYYHQSPINYAPHYESYLWACYLWAYRHTGYPLFLQRAKTAIRMTMQAYPDQWRWTNGLAQERARMLLPLAWLVRSENTEEHRRWLRQVADDLLDLQDPCGALREDLGKPEMGQYGPPISNEDYGEKEATLIQANGDPICDLLYTSNFAFLGLHEAAFATHDTMYIAAEEKLAKFLCRIQVRSEKFPELDGAWFRAFDYRQWTYWGSNADAGWGAWSIESGWTQGWIVAVLGLRQMKTS